MVEAFIEILITGLMGLGVLFIAGLLVVLRILVKYTVKRRKRKRNKIFDT